MKLTKNYMFTNKKHSPKGIMSTILGIISLSSLLLAIFWTYEAEGEAGGNMGTVGFIATCFAVTGMILGYMARREADRFPLFAWLGMLLNFLALAVISMILYAGAYGIG
ncbi:MAG: DUF6142 family protein [Lachnospiraceae bacterium]